MSEIGNGAVFYGEEDVLDEVQSYLENEFSCETFLGASELEAVDFDVVDIVSTVEEISNNFPDVSFIFYDNDSNYSGETVIYCVSANEAGMFVYSAGDSDTTRDNEFKRILSDMALEDAALHWVESHFSLDEDDEEEDEGYGDED